MINHAAEVYPNFKAVATTLREVKTATVNDWSAICWADGEIYQSNQYKGLEIMDRVGGGDSFASGLIYGLMTTGDAQIAVNYGAAHGAVPAYDHSPVRQEGGWRGMRNTHTPVTLEGGIFA